MTCQRFVLLAVLLMGSAAFAHADGVPVDPQMDVSDPTCSTGTTCPSPVGAGQGFTFTANAAGGGIFRGTNQSGSDNTWNSLLITFMPPAGGVGPITCTSGAAGAAPFFSPCSQSTEGNGTVDLFYNSFCIEGTCPSGITPNDIFTITLNNIGSTTGSWPAGLTFLGYANTNPGQETPPINGFVNLTPMPEPGTLSLLGIGLGALAAKRRFRSQRDSKS